MNLYSSGQRFSSWLALAYAGLLITGSLYPFSGFQATGLSAWAFLDAAWPRYWTRMDVAINVLAYVPFGLLLARAYTGGGQTLRPLIFAVFGGMALSLLVEMAQTYLPSRIPSQLDLLSNTIGALFGALAALLFRPIFDLFSDLANQSTEDAHAAGAGLALLALWFVTQVSPETLFATTGNLRRLATELAISGWLPVLDMRHRAGLETLTVACHLLAMGLFLNRLLGSQRPALFAVALVLCAAMLAKLAAHALLVSPAAAIDWLDAGTVRGLIAGLAAIPLVLLLPAPLVRLIAVLSLLGGVLAVNLLPETPYRALTLNPWQLGPFVNMNGLTRWVSLAWPLLALLWLLSGRWHRAQWRGPLLGK